MNFVMQHHCLVHQSQRGVTLVELLIAMTVGLFIMGGMVALFSGTQQNYRVTEQLSRVHENGRFALDVLTREIRQTGYKGVCNTMLDLTNRLDTTAAGYTYNRYWLGSTTNCPAPAAQQDQCAPLHGWDGVENANPTFDANNLTGYQKSTDAIIIKHTANDVTQPQLNMIYLDSQQCILFQNGSNSTFTTTGVTRGPGNSSNATVTGDRQFFSSLYYIGAGGNGAAGLRERRFDDGHSATMDDEELVGGVVDMQITYLVSGQTTYVNANNVTNWNDVAAVRINLLLVNEPLLADQTLADLGKVVETPMSVPFTTNNDVQLVLDNNDLRFYQVFTTTIKIRNS